MKKTTKILTVLLAVAMLLSLAACGGGKGSGTDIPDPSDTPEASNTDVPETNEITTVEAGKLHMSTNALFPPYEMVKDDGSFEGIDVEIATLIAEKLGLELVVDDMDFSAAVNSPAEGKSDMCMAGLTVNEERMKNLDFSTSYAKGVQVVIVPEDSDIATIEDLDGKLIGTQEGTTGYNYCSDSPENGGYGEDAVIAYANGATAVQALLSGKVDCVVIDNMPAQEYVKASSGLKILETEFANEDYAIAVKKGNSDLLSAINAALDELIADGTVQSIIDKYIVA